MADEPMFKDCPKCGRTNPTGAQVCDCGYVLDRDTRELREELEKSGRGQEESEKFDAYRLTREEKARRQAEIESASVVRIVNIKLTFANVFGLTVQFWFASLLCSLVVGAVGGIVYGIVLNAQRSPY